MRIEKITPIPSMSKELPRRTREESVEASTPVVDKVVLSKEALDALEKEKEIGKQ
jgi:hypothetical protein